MSLTTELETPTRDEELARLARTLILVRGFRLYFARCAAGEFRRQILAELSATLPGRVEIYEVEPGLESLRSALEQRIEGTAPPLVIFVTGIETWLPAGEEAAGSMFVRNLNASRDVFAKVLPCPVVVWAADHVLRSIQHGAPDFFSGASGIYLFAESVAGPVALRQAAQSSLESSARWIRELAEVDERLEAIGPDPAGTALVDQIDLLNRKAELLVDLARFREAEPLAEFSYARSTGLLGPEHDSTLASMRILGRVCHKVGRFAEAERLLRRALAADEQKHGEEHPSVAVDLNYLSLVVLDAGRLEESESLMQRLIASLEKRLGRDHPDVARSLNNLAQMYMDAGRYDEAEPLAWRALAIDEGWGNGGELTKSLSTLAELLLKTNRLAQAEPLLRRSVEIEARRLGCRHSEFAVHLTNLAYFLAETNRYAEAEQLIRSALQIDERTYGKDHLEIGTDLNNLAAVLLREERRDEAELLLRRALTIFEGALGSEHHRTKVIAQNLSRTLDKPTR